MSVHFLTDQVYHRAFALIVIVVALTGAASFAAGDPEIATQNFIAIFFGIRLDNYISTRRLAALEAAADAGWQRLRGPVIAD